MMITKKAIPRRTVLRGLGVTVALPLLDSMVPAATAAPDAGCPPPGFGFVACPRLDHAGVTPAQEANFSSSRRSAAGVVPKHVTVLSNLSNYVRTHR